MPLNWDLAKVENWKQLFKEEDEQGDSEMKNVHETILFHTMNVGMSSITEKNCKQFYDRVQMWEKMKGVRFYTYEGHKPIYTTKEDVQRMIGLETNASEFSKTEFLKRLSYGMEI